MKDETINERGDLDAAMARVSFDRSCLDMGWQWSATVAFRDLVCAALDAGGHASSSPVGVAALDMAPDVSSVVQYAGSYAAYYRMTWRREPCPQIAAVNVVLLAETETSRGVRRVVMKAKGRP